MASLIYNRGKVVANGANGWYNGSATYRVLLVTNAYTPNPDHNLVSDVSANELSGGGYARKDVTTRSVVQDNTNDRADYKADNIVYSGLTSTQSFKYAIYYRFGTNDADSDLIACIDIDPSNTLGAAGRNLTGITDYTIKHDNQASNGRVFSGV